jgi:phage FluMu gp28-like protein
MEPSARSARTLVLANGARVHSLSSNPDAQAGKRGTRVLDEFALHPDPRRLFAIAYPGITWGGSLEVISTHRGSASFFHQLVQEVRNGGNPKEVSLHRVTLEDAVREGFLQRLKARLPVDDERQALDADGYLQYVRDRCPDEETWRQEYCCEPADDATAFLSWEAVTGCEADGDDPTPGEALYAGVDVGRTHDRTVVWVLARVGDVLATRELHVLEDAPFAEQEAVLWPVLQRPELRRACIDQSGIGRQLAERAVERFGAHRVERLTFTAPVKEELAYPVRTAFEQRRLRIPADGAVRTDLRSIRRMHTASGTVRLDAARTREGHGDRFWALALALHAAREPLQQPLHFEALGRERRRAR